ncbi:MAG: hypothetical protein ACREJ4_13355 [Candidatus Methylomirabilaceae bacterium]
MDRLITLALTLGLAALPTAWAQARSPRDLAAMVAGIMTKGQVIVASVPLNSGAWGTDFITVSHALGVGRQYGVLNGSGPSAAAAPVMACSSRAHGIDVLVLRVKAQPNQPVVEWGDPRELRAGDELMVYVRKEVHPEPVKVKFLHLNLLEWSHTARDEWEPQWHHVMVGDGLVKPGFSGSPWIRNGKVYGLVKGQIRPAGQGAWYAAAESATRIMRCLKDQHYTELVPRE